MSVAERLLLRNKILGAMVRDARTAAGLSQRECAALLGLHQGDFSDIEHGDRPLSLPELEAFAYLAELPVEHFFGEELLVPDEERVAPVHELLALRDRVIGVLLQQARLSSGLTQDECGQLINTPDSRIAEYEHGHTAMPLAELEILAGELGIPLTDFVDSEHNPLTKRARQSDADKRLQHLPEDLLDFVVDPLNADYLRTALHLSTVPADQLRRIAEALLELTY